MSVKPIGYIPSVAISTSVKTTCNRIPRPSGPFNVIVSFVEFAIANRLIGAFEVSNSIKEHYTVEGVTSKSQDLDVTPDLVLPLRETHVRPLSKLPKPEQQVKVWKRVVDNGERITAKVVQSEVDDLLDTKFLDLILLLYPFIPQSQVYLTCPLELIV